MAGVEGDVAGVSTVDRFRGCLLAGAVGDALGEPVEFMSLSSIRARYGERMALTPLRRAAFTDDTQMTLFTAEGLIRASVRMRAKSITSAIDITHRAYLRWLVTQGESCSRASRSLDGAELDGWLVTNKVLHRQAAPGNTCLSALRSGRVGTMTEPLNDSKGCGGVMRAAPAGLFCSDPAVAFGVGCDVAAITHSHPSGYLSAGALAAMVSALVAGRDMSAALSVALGLLAGERGSSETVEALQRAVDLADRGMPAAEDLERLGGGWVGEEALAIAVACALPASDLAEALSVAVMHSGDSDSTGAICGNLLGAQWGVDAVAPAWLAALEGADLVDEVARDLWTERYDPPAIDEGAPWLQRYPGS